MPETLKDWLPLFNLIGPVGIFALVGWYLWLRYGKSSDSEEPRPHGQQRIALNPERLTRWHEENRDAIRDTHAAALRLEENEREEEKLLQGVVTEQREIRMQLGRFQEALERIERRSVIFPRK